MVRSLADRSPGAGVLFIDRAEAADAYHDAKEQTIRLLRRQTQFDLHVVDTLGAAGAVLGDGERSAVNVVVLWLNRGSRDEWQQLFQLVASVERQVRVIVVFGFDDGTEELAREVMLRDAYAFACPFNPAVLSAYIEANNQSVQSSVQLEQFERRLWEKAQTIGDVVTLAFAELRANPQLGYDRATFDLIDARTNDRYQIGRDNYPNPDRHIQRNINEDQLVQRVGDEGVVILSDLAWLRAHPERLAETGWVNHGATNDIMSWVGIILEHKGDWIGLITLDHLTPGYYGAFGDRTTRYLNAFRRIVGGVIHSFYEQRNQRTVEAAVRAVGQILTGRELLRTVLVVIRNGIGADNCTFFRTESSIDTATTYLRSWVSAKGRPFAPEPPLTKGRIFHRGEGLAGSVLADGRSRIVPHALEHPEFRATPTLSGVDLSMLLVPIYIPGISPDENQIIGVISAYVSGRTDAFTPYDRDLVEQIGRQIALTIQRTLVLENIDVVSSEVNRLLVLGKPEPIMRTVCEHALRATTATEAVIHRLRTADAQGVSGHRSEIDNYSFPPSHDRKPPRLDGTGATDEVLRHKAPVQFSVEASNADKLAPGLKEQGVRHMLGMALRIHSGDAEQTIGVLFLFKYAPGPFTALEIFAVNLFASEAANAIYTLEVLSDLRVLSGGNERLLTAIRLITASRNREEILHNIVVQAHSLVGASFSYMTLRGDKGTYEFQAAWPSYIDAQLRQEIGFFDYDHGTPKKNQQKGVTALAARDKRPILVNDIERERQDPSSEVGREYIDFGLNSQSELAVPIILDEEVLGVINVEHPEKHAFSKEHVRVVELFAEQAAIALQKNQILNRHQLQNRRLAQLLDTLQTIVRSGSDDVLQKALSLTPNAVDAEAMVWVPMAVVRNGRVRLGQEDRDAELEVRIDGNQIASNVPYYVSHRSRLADGDAVSRQVFHSGRARLFTAEPPHADADSSRQDGLPAVFSERGVCYALCLPLETQHERIGVIWFDFGSTPPQLPLTSETIAVFQAYVNQIALVYTQQQHAKQLSTRIKDDKTGIANEIDHHYHEVRWQSLLYFAVALLSSVAGAGLAIYGGYLFFSSTTVDSQWTAGLTTVVGVITEAVGIFVYVQARAAHDRMDRYHQELYRLRQLDVLLLAAEQLYADHQPAMKSAIIEGTLGSWLERRDPEEQKP